MRPPAVETLTVDEIREMVQFKVWPEDEFGQVKVTGWIPIYAEASFSQHNCGNSSQKVEAEIKDLIRHRLLRKLFHDARKGNSTKQSTSCSCAAHWTSRP